MTTDNKAALEAWDKLVQRADHCANGITFGNPHAQFIRHEHAVAIRQALTAPDVTEPLMMGIDYGTHDKSCVVIRDGKTIKMLPDWLPNFVLKNIDKDAPAVDVEDIFGKIEDDVFGENDYFRLNLSPSDLLKRTITILAARGLIGSAPPPQKQNTPGTSDAAPVAVRTQAGAPAEPADAQERGDELKCPRCGGEADNGHDRCHPPNAYNCTKCDESVCTCRKCRQGLTDQCIKLGYDG